MQVYHIILHFHNLRLSNLCTECKGVEEGDLNLFMINEPGNPPLPVLSPFLQLRQPLTIYNQIECQIVSGNLCPLQLPLMAQLSSRISLLLGDS